MKVWLIARTNLRRTFRERSSLFFVFAFPMALILVLGVAYGGSFEPRVGVLVEAPGPLADRLAGQVADADGLGVRSFAAEAELVAAVERGELEAGLVVPAGYDDVVRSADGVASLRFVARPGMTGRQVSALVAAVVGEEAGRLRAARFAAAETGRSFDSGEAAVALAAARTPPVTVEARSTGTAAFPEGMGRFDVGASSQLLLFVFVTSMTSAAALIETRRLGVARRMLATPTSAATVVIGEAAGRFAVAVVQGVVIMLGSALLFGVRWGDPAGAIGLLLAFSLVAGAAGLLLGSVLRTAQQATAVGLLVALGLAALGGSMMPLEFFSPAMLTVAHLITPHAWAADGFAALLRRDAGLIDILPQLGVLLAAAAVLLAAAAWRLRRVLTH